MSADAWTEITLAGHTCEVFRPAKRHPQGFVVIYLHGVHRQRLGDHPKFLQPFADRGFSVVCPSTGPHWWLDMICPDFDPVLTPERFVVDHVLPWIETELGAAPPNIALLGTSMGGQGALRFAYKQPRTFPVVAAISPAIDFHNRWQHGDETLQTLFPTAEAARQQTALLYAQGFNCPAHQFFCCDPEDEEWWEGADRLRMKLYSMGIQFECDLETRGGGHGFEYYTVMASRTAEFLDERLEQKRRTLQ